MHEDVVDSKFLSMNSFSMNSGFLSFSMFSFFFFLWLHIWYGIFFVNKTEYIS